MQLPITESAILKQLTAFLLLILLPGWRFSFK